MNIKKSIWITVLFVVTTLTSVGCVQAIEDVDETDLFHPVEITDGKSISIVDCISAAFKNSPKIRRQKYNLDIAKSNLGIAKAQYFPVIGAGVGFYNENNSDNIYYDSHYRELPAVSLTVNKLVWNFGKTTAYIRMEEFYKIGAEYEFLDSLCSTLFDVKAKYYKLLRAKAILAIAKNNVEINENYVKLAKNKKKPDIATAELHLKEANIQLIEAENEYKNAKIDLSNSMYLEAQPDYTIKNTETFNFIDDYKYGTKTITLKDFTPQEFGFPMNKAVQIAYDNSPDLNVLISTRNAMEQSLLYIKRTYLPDLTANAGYGMYNTNQVTDNSFRVGVNLTTAVNPMELRHSIKGAEAQVNLAENEITLFKKDLSFEVKRAFNNVDKTAREIPVSRLEVEQAVNNLNLIDESYKNDTVSYIALQNARKDYISAITSYVDALYNYNIALIQVEMAMHLHIVDIHHKTEHAVQYHSDELIEHLNKVLNCDQAEIKHNKHNKK